MKVSKVGASLAPLLLSAGVAQAVTFHVEQYDTYLGGDLAGYQNWAANNAPDYTADVSVIDFTDDPNGFAGDFAGSSRWPAAEANDATGTNHFLNNTFFARITATFNVLVADTFTFRTFNDDGVFLLIDGDLVINDPSLHAERVFYGDKVLDVGQHTLELYFFENGGEASLEFSFKDSVSDYSLNATQNAAIGAVPLPGAAGLLASGLIGLGIARRRRNR